MHSIIFLYFRNNFDEINAFSGRFSLFVRVYIYQLKLSVVICPSCVLFSSVLIYIWMCIYILMIVVVNWLNICIYIYIWRLTTATEYIANDKKSKKLKTLVWNNRNVRKCQRFNGKTTIQAKGSNCTVFFCCLLYMCFSLVYCNWGKGC